VLEALYTQMPKPFDVAKGDERVSGALVTVDDATGHATEIRRIQLCSKTSE